MLHFVQHDKTKNKNEISYQTPSYTYDHLRGGNFVEHRKFRFCFFSLYKKDQRLGSCYLRNDRCDDVHFIYWNMANEAMGSDDQYCSIFFENYLLHFCRGYQLRRNRAFRCLYGFLPDLLQENGFGVVIYNNDI